MLLKTTCETFFLKLIWSTCKFYFNVFFLMLSFVFVFLTGRVAACLNYKEITLKRKLR